MSYGIQSEIQRIAFDVRTLVLIEENILTDYKNYSVGYGGMNTCYSNNFKDRW